MAVDGVYKDETLGDTVMKIKYKGIKSSSDTEIEFKSIDDLYCALTRNGKTEFTIKRANLMNLWIYSILMLKIRKSKEINYGEFME